MTLTLWEFEILSSVIDELLVPSAWRVETIVLFTSLYLTKRKYQSDDKMCCVHHKNKCLQPVTKYSLNWITSSVFYKGKA